MQNNDLQLGVPGFNYSDLYDPGRLQQLLEAFELSVKRLDSQLYEDYTAYRRSQGEGLSPREVSALLVRIAPHVGRFVAELFHICEQYKTQRETIKDEIDTIFAFKHEIVDRLSTTFKNQRIEDWDVTRIRRRFELLMTVGFSELQQDHDLEHRVARMSLYLTRLARYYRLPEEKESGCFDGADQAVRQLRKNLSGDRRVVGEFKGVIAEQDDAGFVDGLLAIVQRWCFAAQHDSQLGRSVADWVSFKRPAKRDFARLVDHDEVVCAEYTAWMAPGQQFRCRDGFKLTDTRFDERQVLYEVDYCIYCHQRDTDSCAKGMRSKKTGNFKINPLGNVITGCPLNEKISEMHLLKRDGDNIGALALVVLDNPMCPGTGHRICNDCMKGCIYQKTEPVNIPQIETSVLTDVLFMPYGFEIYSLLTRWNPLNVRRPVALPYNGVKMLVVGLGPAGYTMSHYLLNEGFGVVAIDALKLEPLPAELVGDDVNVPEPIRDFNALYEQLDQRTLAGFGGVAEYGITVRWDKNFLKVIYANLLRRRTFRAYGGVRFGGTVTIDDAWQMGFDHICMAAGAGKPTIIDLENNLIRGIRKASDFLMALQLTGAAKASSLANLQVRLPAGVIGGGLTAIDTATELLAYYPLQVEKFLRRYQKLAQVYGETKLRERYDAEEITIVEEFLAHGKAIASERRRAAAAGEQPCFLRLLRQWGGVTLFYRKAISEAPAYRQNHEEIASALQEGVALVEAMNPKRALQDQYGHLQTVQFEKMRYQNNRWTGSGQIVDIALRNLYIAAGTSPNTIYQSEHPGAFKMDGQYFQRYHPEWNDGALQLVAMADQTIPKVGKPAPLTSYRQRGKYISFCGDNHPVYTGNVVKAMASAKDAYPHITRLFAERLAALQPERQGQRDASLRTWFAALDEAFTATIVAVNRLTPNIVEVVVKAPMQAKNFRPGQFYRVQNYESRAPAVENTVLTSEGIALTGAAVDPEQGTLSLIALELGASSRLCATWKVGDSLVVMGVTGTPTEIPTGHNVLLLGGGLGNAVLFSIGKALRAAGNRVIYFAAYKNRQDMFKIEQIEAASDIIIWSVDNTPGVAPFKPTRSQDKIVVGNIIEAMLAYAKGELGDQPIFLSDIEHLIVIGSDRMMAAVKQARFETLKPYLNQNHKAIGSINSPMQCMMKGICAQCLCKHRDPETGAEYFVYSCYNQDQPLDRVDFEHLHARLRQNSVQEKLSNLWLDYLLAQQRQQGGC